jgi:hypothetical protein
MIETHALRALNPDRLPVRFVVIGVEHPPHRSPLHRLPGVAPFPPVQWSNPEECPS